MIKVILIYWFTAAPLTHYHIEFTGAAQCANQLQYIKKVIAYTTPQPLEGFCLKK